MWFDLGRSEGFPAQYAEKLSPVTVDVLEAGLITAFLILAVSFYVSFITTSLFTNLRLFLRISVCLFIGLILLLGNFGQEWEVGHVESATVPYKAGSPNEINASMEVKIGLRSVNITLNSDTENSSLKGETINYNERFEWTWDQGRFGFGPYAGHLQQQFRAAQLRGLPTPILWIVDYFVIDGEGFRFGRFYRTAGWYSHIAMWSAFACWLLALILFRSVIVYGGYCLGMSGILQLIANLVWLVVRNPNPLVIPVGDETITTKFGVSYWLTFVNGILCLFLSVAIIVWNTYSDNSLHIFFGVDPLTNFSEMLYLTKEESDQLRPKHKSNKKDEPLIEMRDMHDRHDASQDVQPVLVKRKTILGPPKVNRSNKPNYLQT